MAINERLIHTASDSTSEGAGNQEEGLILHLDANDVDSYDGTGTVWYDISDHEFTPTENPEEHFNTVIYNGSNSDQSITGVGFQPDLVWVKCRDVANSHVLADSVRGGDGTRQYFIMSDNTNAQSSSNQIETIDSDGFTVFGNRSATNRSGQEYVAWCFKAGGTAVSNTDGSTTSQVSVNNDLGFSIVETSSTSGAITFGHGLDSAPEMIINKGTSSNGWSWLVYHKDVGTGKYLMLNSTAGTTTNAGSFSSVTSTTITNNSSSTSSDYINYCFTSKRGVSKVGSYQGTGAAGNKVYTGFEPAFVLVKQTTTSQGWVIWDNKRGGDKSLFPFSDTTENTGTYDIDFNADGFTLQSTNTPTNYSGYKYIYLAFAKNTNAADLTPSTDGTEIEKDLAVDPTKVYYSDTNYAIEQDGTVWRGNADNSTGVHEGEAYINNYFESGDTGKFYFEVESLGHTHGGVGFTDPTKYTASSGQGNTSFRNSQFYGLGSNNYKYLGSTGSSFSTTIGTAGVILAVAIDVATRKVWMGIVSSGTITWYNSGDPSAGTNPFFTLPSTFSFYQPTLTDLSNSSGSARTGWHKLLREETASYLPTGFTYMKGAIKNADLELHLDPASYSGSGTTWTADVGNDGTLVGNTSYNQELGDFFDLDGSGDYISLDTSSYLDGDFTIEMWWNFDGISSSSGYKMLWGGQHYGGGTGGLGHYILDNTIKTWVANTSGTAVNVITSSAVLESSKWHHIVLTRSGSSMVAYVDGENVGTGTYSGELSSPNTKIGAHYNTTLYDVDGRVGQVRVYDTALTQDQVRQNLNFTKNDYPNGFNATGVSSSSFNTGGYFNIPTGLNNIAFPLNFKKDHTLVWWAKHGTKTTVDSNSRYRYYMFDMQTGSYRYWHARVDRHATNGYQFQLSWRDSASNYIFTTDVIDSLVNQDDWNMYACYFTGTEGVYYSVNGGDWSSGTATTDVGTSTVIPEGNFLLGKLWSNGSYYSNPNPYDISDIKIFSKVLSSNELSSEYNKGQFGNN